MDHQLITAINWAATEVLAMEIFGGIRIISIRLVAQETTSQTTEIMAHEIMAITATVFPEDNISTEIFLAIRQEMGHPLSHPDLDVMFAAKSVAILDCMNKGVQDFLQREKIEIAFAICIFTQSVS